MRASVLQIACVVAAVFAVACAGCTQNNKEANGAVNGSNVLLADWSGPYGGVPAFDKMGLDALKPALRKGMASQLEEIEAIASNPDPATFENTIEAMERSGHPLDRVMTYWGIWSGNLSTPEFRAIQVEMPDRQSRIGQRCVSAGFLPIFDHEVFTRVVRIENAENRVDTCGHRQPTRWHRQIGGVVDRRAR